MKYIYIRIIAVLFTLSALGQEIQIRGTVTESTSNQPLPGVNIILKGTSIGTITDADGSFILRAPSDGTLIVSYIGYLSKELPIQGQTSFTVSLDEDLMSLEEVVISAYGLEREESQLGYAVQNLNSDELESVADPNLGSALRGKLSGVNINSNSGGVGSSVSINIRGISSLGTNNQPLIVLDGVIIDNNQGQQGDFAGGLDYGNTLSNLNPSDIESISLLKGGNATTLYGFRGNNGVLVITTKKGTTEQVNVEVNSTVTANTPLVAPQFQDQYGQGFFDTGTGQLAYDITQGRSYGPPMDGTERERFDGNGTAPYSPIAERSFKDFFQTGVSFYNSLAISQAKGGLNYRISYSRNDDESIIPGSNLDRQNISLKTSADVAPWLTITGKVDYINQQAKNRPELTDGQSNITRALSLRPRNISNDLLKNNSTTDTGAPNNWAGAFTMNPFFTVNNLLNQDRTDRYLSLLEFDAKITDELGALARVSQDFITTKQEIFNPQGAFDIAPNGRYVLTNSTARTNNYDFILSYNKYFTSNFDLSANVGFLRTETLFEAQQATGETFLIPNFYSLRNFETVQVVPAFSQSVSNSVFGNLTLGINQFIFAELSGRNDWSSTLPPESASFFYPSAGLSVVLSDGVPAIQNSNLISFLKLRGSYAQMGNATTPFQLINTYNTSSNQWNGQRFFFYGEDEEGAGLGPVLKNANLVPEKSNTYEFGFDVKFLFDRIGLNATYYFIETSNQILNLSLPPASGAAGKIINAGLVTSKGVELTLTADPVKTARFSWTTTLNYTTNKNVVKELANGVERNILVRQFNDIVQVAAEVGSSPQALFGTTFERDDAGNPVYGTDGLPRVSSEISKIGDAAPDAFVNWNNIFSFGQFNASFLIDSRIGGDLFAFSDLQRHTSGTAVETLQGREYYAGGQGILVPENAVIFEGGSLDPTVAARGVDPQTYWGRVGTISENWVIDGSFVKLREVSLGYTFPSQLIQTLSLSNLSISYVGRNLAILHSNTDNFDPETGFNTSFSGVEYYGIPTSRSHGFRLNIGF